MSTLRRPEAEPGLSGHWSPDASASPAAAVHLAPPAAVHDVGGNDASTTEQPEQIAREPNPARLRRKLAAELVLTMLVGIVGSAGLFAVLGGWLLIRRLHAGAVVQSLSGGGILVGGLLLLALWASLGLLPRKLAIGPELARVTNRLPRLPYGMAGGFFAVTVAGGASTLLGLPGLRAPERTVAALMWGASSGVVTLGVWLRLRSVFAALNRALPGRSRGQGSALFSVRSKLLGGFGWLLLWSTALALLKQIWLGLLAGREDGPAWRWIWILLPVQVAAAGGVVAMAVVGLAWPVRDLLHRAGAVVSQSRGGRGELQRPIVLGVSAPAEVIELQRLFEQLRRLLLARLRSSTEQNLQLEAEVARRSAELSRRNTELSDALVRLESAREELLRAEKLATVGRIAAGITGEIDAPVARMADSGGTLSHAIAELLAQAPAAPAAPAAPPDRGVAPTRLIGQALTALDVLSDSARRVRDIVRAMRVYVRPGETQAGRCDVYDVIDDVRQLFGEPFRHAIQVVREDATAAGASQVVTVRSDLALLLTSWLGRVEPRLRERAEPRVVVRLRSAERRGQSACEITVRDNGRPLTAQERIELPGPELLRRLGAQAFIRQGPQVAQWTEDRDADPDDGIDQGVDDVVSAAETSIEQPGWETVLTVRLPMAASTAELPR